MEAARWPLPWVFFASLALTSCGGASTTTVIERTVTQTVTGAETQTEGDGLGPLTLDGVDGLDLGMTVAEAEQASGATFTQAGDFCVSGTGEAEGLTLELNNGRVDAILLSEPSKIKTSSGIGIGDPISAVPAAYGAQAKVGPGPGDEQGIDYIFVPNDPGDADRRIGFTSVEGKIVEIALGAAGDIDQRVEFCA